MPTLVIDLIVDDPSNDEFVLCIVETGPWVESNDRLKQLQDRLYNLFDAAVDGHVAGKYPYSRGRKIRLQVDSYDAPPKSVFEFVRKFSSHLQSDPEYQEAVTNSPFVKSIRLVNGVDIGRKFN